MKVIVYEAICLLERFQTLITGILAVGIGALTIRAMNATTDRQIVHLRDVEEEKRIELLRAARAMLPFALSEIVQYSAAAASELKSLLQTNINACVMPRDSILILQTGTFTAPDFPISSLRGIKDVIEVAPSKIARELVTLLTRSQVCNSRLKGLQAQSAKSISSITDCIVEGYAIDVAELHAWASRFYRYGRLKDDHVLVGPMTSDEVIASARLIEWNADDRDFIAAVEKVLAFSNRQD